MRAPWARPEHHGRLWPAQERKSQTTGERTDGTNALGGIGKDAELAGSQSEEWYLVYY